jgi:hypothetical protein
MHALNRGAFLLQGSETEALCGCISMNPMETVQYFARTSTPDGARMLLINPDNLPNPDSDCSNSYPKITCCH